MSRAVRLLFGVHAHQPVGNFSEVLKDAHARCYRPFLQVLARYPEFRFAAHFSGWLLTELERDYPQDMALLRAMVDRGQVEMVGGGIAEPVLAAIPHRDRCSQLNAMNAHLATHYGEPPTGAWLTERVWESSIVPALSACGLRYVTVDDYHFLCTGLAPDVLDAHYLTEEEGLRLALFPIAEGLRYRLPFAPAAEAVRYLESLAARGDRAAIYFDDIEKFGIWPETYDWVYTRGWLTEFVEGVLASPAITTSTYASFIATEPARGLVYLPTASYSEMNEWTLPAPAARRYAALVRRAQAEQRLDEERPFLRGGIWRNFLSRYAESNWMHKRMLALSARLAAEPPDPARTALLHAAQANDAYWHGLFGGLYLPHLRRAIWRNLVLLEAALPSVPATGNAADASADDFDGDGREEHFLRDATQVAACRDDGLGGLHEWSSFALAHNFGDTLRRYEEHYHVTAAQTASTAPDTAAHSGGIASAHERVAFKQAIDPAHMVPDRHPRLLFVDAEVDGDRIRVLDDFTRQAGDARSLDLAGTTGLRKRYALSPGRLHVTYSNASSDHRRMITALHLAMPSCDGFGGRYRLADDSIPGGFGQAMRVEDAKCLWLEDSELRGRLRLDLSRPVTLVGAPFYTVSQSEAGFEQIMQATRIELHWTAGSDLTVSLSIETC